MARGATAEVAEEKALVIIFPVGRMTNNSLLVRDAFKSNPQAAPGKPAYRIEVAYDPASLAEVMDKTFEWAQNTFGDNIYFDCDADTLTPEDKKGKLMVVTPFKDGAQMKLEREARGKEGGAYDGKIVIRSKTYFNREGQDGEGGCDVVNEAVEPITAVNRSELYNGMNVTVAVTPEEYKPNQGGVGITFYLKAVQKHSDGEPLVSKGGGSSSALFSPLKKAGAVAAAGGARAGRGTRK